MQDTYRPGFLVLCLLAPGTVGAAGGEGPVDPIAVPYVLDEQP